MADLKRNSKSKIEALHKYQLSYECVSTVLADETDKILLELKQESFLQINKKQTSSLAASFAVARQSPRSKKPYNDGTSVCRIAKVFNDNSLAAMFNTVKKNLLKIILELEKLN